MKESRGALRAAVRTAALDVANTVRGRDLALAAGGMTFYAGIAVVPWLLLAVGGAALLSSPALAAERLADLRALVPAAMGAPPVWDALVAAGLALGPWGALVTLFPASFYGEGLRRACLRLDPRPDRFTGWRARLALLPLAAAVPFLALGVLAAAPLLADLARTGGVAATLGQVVVAFHVSWVAVGVVLSWAFGAVAPGRPRPVALLLGAFGTSAVVCGFLQGFLLFLALPIDLGVPFGGLAVVGGVVAVGLWLFVLHLLLLVGWVATTVLDRGLRERRARREQPDPPAPAPARPTPVAAGAAG